MVGTNVHAQRCTSGGALTRESDDLLLRAVARLYYVDDLPEREVADVVGISRSRVSRLLSRARERGIVRITVDEYEPRNRALENELTQRFGLKHGVVVRTAAGRSPEHVRRSVGYFAAPVASQLIRNGDVLGVAGGRTLAELVRFMTPRPEPAGLTVVQLMGNVDANVTAIDAVELSRVLAQRLGGTLYTVSAPAFVADASSRDVFHSHEHVRSVWQLFDRMHTAFVGIGTLNESVFIERGVLDAAGLATLRAHGAVGEICGRFFDEDGGECDTPYRDRVISVDLETLRRMRDVIGVTNGTDRAHAVLAALRGGILKSLIIDEGGAAAVLAAQAVDPARIARATSDPPAGR